MTKVLTQTGGDRFTTVTPLFWAVGAGAALSQTAQIVVETPTTMRAAGTFSSLWWTSLSGSGLTDVLRFRKNGVNGNQVLFLNAVPASTNVRDTTNTDTVAVNDGVNYQYVTSGGASIDFSSITTLFEAAANTVTIPTCANSGRDWSALGTTTFWPFNGLLLNDLTETNVQAKSPVAGTVAFMSMSVATNARTTTTTLAFRKNGVTGAGLVSVGAGVTGVITDTTNTDTIAVGDFVNYTGTLGTGVGAFTTRLFNNHLTTTDKSWPGITMAPNGGGFSSDNGNVSEVIAGQWFPEASNIEAGYVETRIGTAGVQISRAAVQVSTNNRTSATAVIVVLNGNPSGVGLNVGVGVTGWVTDTTNTATTTSADDLTCWRTTTGTGAGELFAVMGQSARFLGPTAPTGATWPPTPGSWVPPIAWVPVATWPPTATWTP